MPATLEDRQIAHTLVSSALKRGELVRPDICSVCNRSSLAKLHAHHDDYSQPLVVRWLCRSCHKREHWSEGPPQRTMPAPQQRCASCNHSIHWHGQGDCKFSKGCDCAAYKPLETTAWKFY